MKKYLKIVPDNLLFTKATEFEYKRHTELNYPPLDLRKRFKIIINYIIKQSNILHIFRKYIV